TPSTGSRSWPARSDTAEQPPEPRQRPALPAGEERIVHLDDHVRDVCAVGLPVPADQRAQELLALVPRLLADGSPAKPEPIQGLRHNDPLPPLFDDCDPEVPVLDSVERIPSRLLPAHTAKERAGAGD